MSASQLLLLNLLQRGDEVSIASGRLIISSKSGKTVPDGWLKDHWHSLVCELLCKTNTEAFSYQSYSTGEYGDKRFSGVALQFSSVLLNDEAYVVFNADLKRLKTTSKGKKGAALPKGQFRVGKKSLFCKFWRKSGLDFPPRLASFYDYMGNLKPLLFIGEYQKGEQLNKASLELLNISYPHILRVFDIGVITDKTLTDPIHHPDKCHTALPDKELSNSQVLQGVKPILATGVSNYGTRLKGNTDIGGKVIPVNTHKRPEEQTSDEWLADYDL